MWNSVDGDPFIILATFDETLESSRKSSAPEVPTRWSAYRKELNKEGETIVGIIDNSELEIVDPMAGNNKEYIYLVYPESENLIGSPMTSDSVKNESGWAYTIANLLERSDGVYISNEIWNLRMNVSSSEVTQNLDISSLETLGKFNKISRGDKNYLSTSVTAWLGGINSQTGKYDCDAVMLNDWRDFISGSDKYIFKDRFGDVRIVTIIDNPTSKAQDETSEQAQEVSISVEEIMDVSDLKRGVLGDYSTSGDKTYTHVQTLSSERWIITHALNKYPKVSVIDQTGKVIYAQITHVNKQIVDIRFSRPVTGSAYFN